MAYKLAYAMLDASEKEIVKIKVPAGITDLAAGEVLALNGIDTTGRAGNIDVYNAKVVADVATEDVVIIVDQAFEELADGRRPEGNSNPGKRTFKAGDIITALRLHNDQVFFISEDTINGTPVVGEYLVAANASRQLVPTASFTNEKVVLAVEVEHVQPQGGQFGAELAEGIAARVEVGR